MGEFVINKTADNRYSKIEDRLRAILPDPHFSDDKFVVIVVKEAIKAAKEGNVGVGAVLVNGDGEIIQKGHNRIFHPYFRSDLHAEMDVMNKFEEKFKHINRISNYVLYTSLEPCPMCFARLITSGIPKVFYATVDNKGGMVRMRINMPPIWRKLSKKQEFKKAQCSTELSDMAKQVWLMSLEETNRKFLKRQNGF